MTEIHRRNVLYTPYPTQSSAARRSPECKSSRRIRCCGAHHFRLFTCLSLRFFTFSVCPLLSTPKSTSRAVPQFYTDMLLVNASQICSNNFGHAQQDPTLTPNGAPLPPAWLGTTTPLLAIREPTKRGAEI